MNGPLSFDAAMTQVREAVKRREIVLVKKNGDVLSTVIDPMQFVTMLQLAFAMSGHRQDHVLTMVRAIAADAAKHGGAVQVQATAWLVLQTYAKTGGLAKRTEQVISRPKPLARVLP